MQRVPQRRCAGAVSAALAVGRQLFHVKNGLLIQLNNLPNSVGYPAKLNEPGLEMLMRRFLKVTLCAAMLCALSVVSALAQEFPSRTVLIVVPYPAGGSTDVLARALGSELSKIWGQSVVVENVAGASSIIGANKVAKAAPDGHTLLLTIDPTVVSNRFLFKTLPYDPDKSLVPITMLARSGQMVLANPSFPANSMREVVEIARSTPGKVAYASFGIGTTAHLMFETIGKREGVQFLHVPYKGIMPDVIAVAAGEVQITLASPATAGPMVRAGKIKALAIGGQKRSSLFPEVPTVAEAGYPYVDSVIWWGLFAPEGTSAQLVDRINHDVISIVKRPDFIAKYLTKFGIDLVASTPAEFADTIRADVKINAEMVKAAGVQPQ
jgi:tripartite-type tricarboxylate transporter receptor subunit TctC